MLMSSIFNASSQVVLCRAWRSRAQFHLFTHLRISGRGLSQYESILLKSPTLCDVATEFFFYNHYVRRSKCEIENKNKSEIKKKTVETAFHAIRIAHKLSRVDYLHMLDINLVIEHPHLPRHAAALININQLVFTSSTQTKISHLSRLLVGLKGLFTPFLDVTLIVDSDPLPLPAPCYFTKSSLTKLYLVIQPDGHILLDWLVQAVPFTTSLEMLDVELVYQLPQPQITLCIQCIQSLLGKCAGILKEWIFWASITVDDSSKIPEVSLASHKSLPVLEFIVSPVWFRHALEQLKSSTSEHITEITFHGWLDDEETSFDEFWEELDITLSKDIFKSLRKMNVSYVFRGGDYTWHAVNEVDVSRFDKLLPRTHKRGIMSL